VRLRDDISAPIPAATLNEDQPRLSPSEVRRVVGLSLTKRLCFLDSARPDSFHCVTWPGPAGGQLGTADLSSSASQKAVPVSIPGDADHGDPYFLNRMRKMSETPALVSGPPPKSAVP